MEADHLLQSWHLLGFQSSWLQAHKSSHGWQHLLWTRLWQRRCLWRPLGWFSVLTDSCQQQVHHKGSRKCKHLSMSSAILRFLVLRTAPICEVPFDKHQHTDAQPRRLPERESGLPEGAALCSLHPSFLVLYKARSVKQKFPCHVILLLPSSQDKVLLWFT